MVVMHGRAGVLCRVGEEGVWWMLCCGGKWGVGGSAGLSRVDPVSHWDDMLEGETATWGRGGRWGRLIVMALLTTGSL